MKAHRWVWLCVGALACKGPAGDDSDVAGCSEADLDACEYASPDRAFTERNTIVTDPESGRELPIRIRVPEGEGPFPVVVYSHGGGLNDTGHVFGAQWGEALASHDLITVNIGHATMTVAEAEAFCTIGAVPEGECDATLAGDDSGMIAIVKRTDIVTVLDAIPGLAATAEGLGGPEVDLERLAVIGWSAGSRATVAVRGAQFRPSASAPMYSESDDRIDAIVAFSPTGPGFGSFFADEEGSTWDTLDGPSLMSTGVNDVKPDNTALTGAIRREAYENQPADGSRRLLYSNLAVGIGGHGTYNLEDLGSDDERLDRFSRSLRSAVRAFLDEHLRDDAEAAAWLETDDARVLAGDADWTAK